MIGLSIESHECGFSCILFSLNNNSKHSFIMYSSGIGDEMCIFRSYDELVVVELVLFKPVLEMLLFGDQSFFGELLVIDQLIHLGVLGEALISELFSGQIV